MAEVQLDLHRAVFEGERQLSGIAYELKKLARALAQTGNKGMAMELTVYADKIEEVGDDVVAAYGRDLNKRVDEANESLNRMFSIASKMSAAVSR